MRPKLLLADDSVTIQRVIELTFADEDINVVTAGDGREAIERVQAEQPDIVLADIGMPERDGYEVAEYIKGNPQLSHIPVLLLTGAFEPVDEGRARAIGCDGVLVKPFEPQMVISRVRELLAGHGVGPVRAPSVPAPVSYPVPTPVPAPPRPAAAADPAEGERSNDGLEAYFDRLDAALSNLSPAPPSPPTVADDGPNGSAAVAEMHARAMAVVSPRPPAVVEPRSPRHERESGRGQEPAGTRRQDQPAGAAQLSMPELQAAFVALLAAEEGGPAPFEEIEPEAPDAEPLSEAAIDEIVERVIARMGDARMRTLVLDTAERLVREEIDRIKKQK